MAGPQNGNVHVPAPMSRRRPPPTGEEEAGSRLILGDMEGEIALSPSEVTVLLDKLEENSANAKTNHTEIYIKTREYCKMFARFKDPKVVENVERISSELTRRDLDITAFERAQLATLCCDTAEEARTLIPSLDGKVGEEELQAVLDDISKLRDFS